MRAYDLSDECPRAWDAQRELASGVTACTAGDWCVLFVRASSAWSDAITLDGDAIRMPPVVSRGTFQLRRIQRPVVL